MADTPAALAVGYTSEVDQDDGHRWSEYLDLFVDSNIYQSWSYGQVLSGAGRISNLVLKKDGEVRSIAQARIMKIPGLRFGIAYVRWGPVCLRRGFEEDPDVLRQALRALRNEFAVKRGLTVRLLPAMFTSAADRFSEALCREGFSTVDAPGATGRTILMDLAPSVDELRQGLSAHWRRELKSAERRNLEVVEGSDDWMFSEFIRIYKEMVGRKKFVEPNDIYQFSRIQQQAKGQHKMIVMLCRLEGQTCAGLVCSALGTSAVYIFGATSNAGMKSGGSYLLHWNLLRVLKDRGIQVYNLNGINPATNPGTYKFKSGLAGANGKEAAYAGRFDCPAGAFSYLCIKQLEAARIGLRRSQQLQLRQLPDRIWRRLTTLRVGSAG